MIPKYLYHYTSIDTLKKILENKTIKFSRLDTMNDPLEGIITINESQELLNARKCMYCSCWSEESEESISMWGVYNRFRGVRIKARSDLFADFQGVMECECGFVPYGAIDPVDSGVRATIDKRPIMINKVYGPIKVTYQPLSELQGCIAKEGDFWEGINEPSFKIKIADIGNHKNSFWEYEKEWRYKLSAFSAIGARDIETLKSGSNDYLMKEMYVHIKRNIEEIVMGPETTDDEFHELVKYLNDKELNICIRKSDIALRNMY
ncbi:hypothetical protein [Butyrivibrio sp. MB2005]|uniref:hypothetical protein n=1 Tax=Butyrivibrio sp. MB2005 TaxID=1280678 RepID=UPI00041391EF|nr:hypothetical protein [Butyrivibrio sp. MB2005]